MLLTAPILAAFAYFALIATAVIGVQIFGVTTLMRVYYTPLAQATAALTAFLVGGAAVPEPGTIAMFVLGAAIAMNCCSRWGRYVAQSV